MNKIITIILGIIGISSLVAGITIFAIVKIYGGVKPPIIKDVTSYSLEPEPAIIAPNLKHKRIHHLVLPAEQVVILAGVVGQDTQGVAAAINQAASNKAPVFLLISSPGGSIIDGASIINAMEAAQVPVYTVCMDLCASMAAIIHQYGTERFMADRAILMFHDAAGQFQGYFPHIKAQFEAVERYFTRFNVYIAKRQGVTLTALEAAEHKNMWVDSEDAMLRKMNDRLVYIEVISQNKALDVKALLSVKPQGRTLPVIGPVAPNFSSENL